MLDEKIFYAVNHLHHDAVNDAIFLFIHYATRDGLLYFALGIMLLISRKKLSIAFVKLGLISGLTTFLLTDAVLKNIFQRERPFQVLAESVYLIPPVPDSYSMPSGQAAVAVCLAVMWWLVFGAKKSSYAFVLFALVVMFDRIYMGHHYPSDVLVGGLIGAGVALLIYRFRKIVVH